MTSILVDTKTMNMRVIKRGRTTKHILLVEDDESVYLTVKTILKPHKKYKLFYAETCRDAETILKKDEIDVIILDLGLPDRPGIDLLDQVKKSELKNIEIIVLTAKDCSKTTMDCLYKGAFWYILKEDMTLLPFLIQRALRIKDRNDNMHDLMEIMQTFEIDWPSLP